MARRVAIVSMGWSGFKPAVGELSFREMMFEAALRAYDAIDLDPRSDVDAFVSCQEDFWEGIAITDEFAPEPIGGVLRPTFTVAGNMLQGIAQAYMMIKTGYFDVVVVESHAKPSDVTTLHGVFELALDPLYVRPLRIPNIHFIAGVDATAYLERSGLGREHLALVVAKNKRAGLSNPRASHAAPLTVSEILEAKPVVYPLTRYDIAPYSDAAIVAVLASEEAARRLTDAPVWVDGVSWITEAGTGAIAWHTPGAMPGLRVAARQAYAMAGVSKLDRDVSLAEVEDRYSYIELLALEELGLGSPDEIAKMLDDGDLSPGGYFPVNASGGSLAAGVAFEATSGFRLLEAYLNLLDGVFDDGRERAVVASWRGPPTRTFSVAVLSA